MEKTNGNTHVFVLSCKFLTSKHKNEGVSMYFLHLVLTFTPHYIITDKPPNCNAIIITSYFCGKLLQAPLESHTLPPPSRAHDHHLVHVLPRQSFEVLP